MRLQRQRLIRSLFDEYIEMYAARDDRLTARFSENFSGYAGSSGLLVKDRDEWVRVTRQDFAQVTERIRIEMLDLSMQDLCNDTVVVTAFFHIHLPIPDQILSREIARLVLIFRLEGVDWKIVHSGISIPYHMAGEGEVYPLKGLQERNRELVALVKERTRALEEANNKLELLTMLSHQVRKCLAFRLHDDTDIQTIAQALNYSARTLGRRLAGEGTTFQQIKDALRRDVALQMLTGTEQSVATISAAIGFTSITTFHRAFKIWTGGTPKSYRQRQENSSSDHSASLAAVTISRNG